MKRILSFILVVLIVFSAIPMQSVYAITPEDWVGGKDWASCSNAEKWALLATHAIAQMGCVIVDRDAGKFIEGWASLKDWVYAHDADDYVNEDSKNITIPKEFIELLRQAIDNYAKTEQTKEENGGFYLMPTINYEDVPMDTFNNSYMYYTFRNIVREKGILSVRLRSGDVWFVDPFSDPDHLIYLVGDASYLNSYLRNQDIHVYTTFFCANDWRSESYPIMLFKEKDKIHYSCSEAEQYNTGSVGYLNASGLNKIDTYNYTIYSTTGERVRVFVSSYAAKNYSAGNRKIYFSENYYNYVPEDLTVSIDDLQKSVDDLQKIIDELLKKINDLTSEREIEELLRLILEEIRKNPGGGGSGSGSGDVTVSVDLKETNSWLSKIYNRLGDILTKMSESAGQSMDEVVDSIENLKEMLEKYLKTITSDLDDIKDQLADMSEQEFSDQTESFLDDTMGSFSEVSEKAKGKFPFSIPNDIRLLISKMSVSQPEDHGRGTYSVQTLAYDEDVGNGSLISVMDEGGGDVPVISETGAPIFYLPFVIASAEIEQYVLIDLSGFEPISRFCRSLMTIWFVLCLYNLTFKVMGLWGDLVD